MIEGQPPEIDHAAPFRRVAHAIDLNRESASFGGAFCIVAPDGTTLDLLILDNSQNAAIFYGLIKTRAEIALAEIEDAQRGMSGGFGGRR